MVYGKNMKKSDTKTCAVIIVKICTMWFYHRVMCPKVTDRMANSVDPDQTAPCGAV